MTNTLTTPVETETVVTTVAIDKLAPHPHNPRRNLGDLSELIRSVKAHGVLQHAIVLPAGDDGIHLIVAGHRRHAAAKQADLTTMTVVIRDFTETEAVEAMLVENVERADLNVREEIDAIARLMSLDAGYTPKRLCTRIGKSQRWIKERLAVAALDAATLTNLENGKLTLRAAVAASTLADLGPETVAQACQIMTERRGDPQQICEQIRKDLQHSVDRDNLAEKLRAAEVTHDFGHAPFKPPAKNLRDLGLDTTAAKAHVKEPCHAVAIVDRYDGPAMIPFCTDPKRHRNTAKAEAVSPIRIDTPSASNQRGDSNERRKARKGRVAAGTEIFERTKRAPKRAELINLALLALIDTAGSEADTTARRILGVEPGTDLAELAARSPAELARVAAAVACGAGEQCAYHGTRPITKRWVRLLIDHGWTADDWTSEHHTQ